MELVYTFIRKTFGFLIKRIWIKEVTGLERIPLDGAAIFAFNHQSYFDFLCFVAIAPRNVHFLAAEKFFDSLLWRSVMFLTGQIKVDRTIHDKQLVHDIVHEHLFHGKVIGIFPEGTRSPDREKMLFAFSGVAKYATRSRVPVIPVGIRGTYDVMSRHDAWPKFHKVVTIHVGQPISFDEYDHTKMNHKGYRALTDKVMLSISELSDKKYEHVGVLERPE